ncbi:MAG: hypothetical protein LBP20_01820 [Treponema sp.]|jgi:hypothetical protein|nr:hypothetical protein [Treponema sp.]
MKKYLIICIVIAGYLFSAQALSAQLREDIKVYVSPVSGGMPEQQMFFAENFRMELIGANYTVVDTPVDSDYTMNLSITQDVETDYADEYGAAEQIVNVLTVSLLSTKDAREILQFSWVFKTLEEMYEWNLHLIYQAMANVPLTKLTGVADTSHWRNKWVYLRGSFDYPITFYAVSTENTSIHTPNPSQKEDHARLDHQVRPFPGLTLGLEFQFFNWMSVEGDFKITFGEPLATSFIPAIETAFKFPVKPSRHFMIEPYGVVSFPSSTSANTFKFPVFGFGGGVQLGVKGGEMGAFFVDVNYIHYVGDVVTANRFDPSRPEPSRLHWTRFTLGIGVGYKIGFFNRNKDDKGQVITM